MSDVLVADHAIEYVYTRSTGPIIGAFMTALRDRRIVGVRASDGRVLVPPVEYEAAYYRREAASTVEVGLN